MADQTASCKCQCASRCGDDPEVTAGRVLGCVTHRMRRNPDHLGALVERLSEQLRKLVDLLDRMEPEVPFENRATDEEWDAIKADAKRVLAEVE